MNLKAFAWEPLHKWGTAVLPAAADISETVSPVEPPDFLAGELPPSQDGYDQFGWKHQGGRLVTEVKRLTRLEGCSVLRYSLGRARWHVISQNQALCAQDSYHDGEWIGPFTGETIRIPMKKDVTLTVNIRDDAPITTRVDSPAVLIGHFWADNYAHTLLETASRFWALEQCPAIAKLPVVWEIRASWQQEIADWLCPGRANPLPENHCRFDTLYVPSFYSQIGTSKAAVRWLRQRFGAPDAPGKRRILVSRADASARRILNESAVADKLRPMGFEVVTLTGMSVASQREMFRSAEIIVMPHGAGCANLIFAGAGTKVIEFAPKSYQHPMFWHIAKWSGHWYARIVVNDNENKDMVADLAILKRALEAAGL